MTAAEFIKVRHPQDYDDIPQWHIDDLEAYAAQQKPPSSATAEEIPTAKEFVHKYYNLPQSKVMTVRIGSLIKCLERLATLHAQKIADMMDKIQPVISNFYNDYQP